MNSSLKVRYPTVGFPDPDRQSISGITIFGSWTGCNLYHAAQLV